MAVIEPTIAKSTVELKAYFDGTRNWIDYKDLCIADKLSTMHCVTHDRNGKKLDTGSKRLALNLKTISILSWAGNQWVKRNELSDKLFKIPGVGLSKSSIKVYLTDLEKIGFLESAVDKDLNKCVRINEELYKA